VTVFLQKNFVTDRDDFNGLKYYIHVIRPNWQLLFSSDSCAYDTYSVFVSTFCDAIDIHVRRSNRQCQTHILEKKKLKPG